MVELTELEMHRSSCAWSRTNSFTPRLTFDEEAPEITLARDQRDRPSPAGSRSR